MNNQNVVQINDREKQIATKTDLKSLVKTFYDLQENRTALAGRLKIKANGKDQVIQEEQKDTWNMTEIHKDILTDLWVGLRKQMNIIEKCIKLELEKFPIYVEFLKDINGLGHMMSAYLISELDVHKADTVSAFTQFCGLSAGLVKGKIVKKKNGKIVKENGKMVITETNEFIRGDKRVKGFLSPCNMGVKSKILGNIAPNFLMDKYNNPYKVYYVNTKTRLQNSYKFIGGDESRGMWKDTTDGHRHIASLRKMAKELIKDLWIKWRELEGLDVRVPYADEYLGKVHSS